ncbi:MAG: hypothetical protein ACD_29C00023G0008 [uncultured bacterium]|nr:MAG: hypothetical protein ACD_29C00023G0008 [uncultured bacterium]
MNKEMTLTYYANITRERDGYTITFRDLPNVFSEGETIDEALRNAQEALDGVLSVMTEEDYEVPIPTRAKKNEYPIPVSANIAAPILLRLVRKQHAQSQSAIARSMDVPYQQYQRLEHNCNMTLKSLKRAATAMGSRVEIKFYLK